MIKVMPRGVLVDITGSEEITGSRVIVRARENFKFRGEAEKAEGEQEDKLKNTRNMNLFQSFKEDVEDRGRVEEQREQDMEKEENEKASIVEKSKDDYSSIQDDCHYKNDYQDNEDCRDKNDYQDNEIYHDINVCQSGNFEVKRSSSWLVEGRSLMLLILVENDGGGLENMVIIPGVLESRPGGTGLEKTGTEGGGFGKGGAGLPDSGEAGKAKDIAEGADSGEDKSEDEVNSFEIGEDEILVKLKISLEELELEVQDLKLIEVFAEDRGAFFPVFIPYRDKIYEIYSDGACQGNPGPGGYAAIVLESGEVLEEVSGACEETTNNRMELLAVIRGVESLAAGSRVRIYTDSSYALRGMEEWLDNWKSNGWVTSGGKPVKNQDLWKRIAELQEKYRVDPVKVKGHSGDEMNNRADQLAKKACKRGL